MISPYTDQSSSSSSAPPLRNPPRKPSASPLSITVRFAISLPDLTIFIPDSQTTTLYTLKRQIREARPADAGRRRLRLIYAGKVLTDGFPLSTQIKPPKPPPQQTPPKPDPKGKGKAKEPDEVVHKVYIHCSIGDELSDEELAKEAQDQATPAPTHTPSTLPQPLGFDRLLSAGFTEADVAALRSQFNRLHGNLGSEDTRILEDRWIDESAGQGQQLADGSPAGTNEDILIGTAIGFFWPVAIFLMREEGVFTKRRQMAIIAGILVNLAFSVLRSIAS
ncbi:hypothetical protein RUND412_001492 [Rhizina undulata]